MQRVAELLARPLAHRGLHDSANGIIENSRSAVQAALDSHYGIEVDVQLTKDGEALVFHDENLERLTTASGPVRTCTLDELRSIGLRNSTDTLWSLAELLDQVQGKTPLVIEVKSNWSGKQDQLIRRVAELIEGYKGSALIKSFDPRMIILLRRKNPDILRGIIGCSYSSAKEWPFLDSGMRFAARNLLHWPMTRPHALSWDIRDLPRLSVSMAQRFLHVPVMSWTVRTPADREHARIHADQIVFEGFRP